MNTSRDEIIKQYVFQFIQNRKAKRGLESHPIHITCKPKWLSMEPAHISAVQRQGEFTANLKKVLGVFWALWCDSDANYRLIAFYGKHFLISFEHEFERKKKKKLKCKEKVPAPFVKSQVHGNRKCSAKRGKRLLRFSVRAGTIRIKNMCTHLVCFSVQVVVEPVKNRSRKHPHKCEPSPTLMARKGKGNRE